MTALPKVARGLVEQIQEGIQQRTGRKLGVVGVILIDEQDDGRIAFFADFEPGLAATPHGAASVHAIVQRLVPAIRGAVDAQADAEGGYTLDADQAAAHAAAGTRGSA